MPNENLLSISQIKPCLKNRCFLLQLHSILVIFNVHVLPMSKLWRPTGIPVFGLRLYDVYDLPQYHRAT